MPVSPPKNTNGKRPGYGPRNRRLGIMRRAHQYHEKTGAGVYVLIDHDGQYYAYSSGRKPPPFHLKPTQFGPTPTPPRKRRDFPPPHKDVVSHGPPTKAYACGTTDIFAHRDPQRRSHPIPQIWYAEQLYGVAWDRQFLVQPRKPAQEERQSVQGPFFQQQSGPFQWQPPLVQPAETFARAEPSVHHVQQGVAAQFGNGGSVGPVNIAPFTPYTGSNNAGQPNPIQNNQQSHGPTARSVNFQHGINQPVWSTPMPVQQGFTTQLENAGSVGPIDPALYTPYTQSRNTIQPNTEQNNQQSHELQQSHGLQAGINQAGLPIALPAQHGALEEYQPCARLQQPHCIQSIETSEPPGVHIQNAEARTSHAVQSMPPPQPAFDGHTGAYHDEGAKQLADVGVSVDLDGMETSESSEFSGQDDDPEDSPDDDPSASMTPTNHGMPHGTQSAPQCALGAVMEDAGRWPENTGTVEPPSLSWNSNVNTAATVEPLSLSSDRNLSTPRSEGEASPPPGPSPGSTPGLLISQPPVTPLRSSYPMSPLSSTPHGEGLVDLQPESSAVEPRRDRTASISSGTLRPRRLTRSQARKSRPPADRQRSTSSAGPSGSGTGPASRPMSRTSPGGPRPGHRAASSSKPQAGRRSSPAGANTTTMPPVNSGLADGDILPGHRRLEFEIVIPTLASRNAARGALSLVRN